MSVNRCEKRPSDTATVIQTTSFKVPPARWSVFSRFLKACRTCASKFPAREDPLSSTNPTWPASHMVLPPSVMTAGENEYFASQDGSRIVFFSAISISTKALAHGRSTSDRGISSDRPGASLAGHIRCAASELSARPQGRLQPWGQTPVWDQARYRKTLPLAPRTFAADAPAKERLLRPCSPGCKARQAPRYSRGCSR